MRMRATLLAYVVLSAAVLPAQTACAAPGQAHSGRIDLYAVDAALELSAVGAAPRAKVGLCSWLGRGRERTGITCEKVLGRDWEQLWVEFVARADGEVDIDLQGEYYERTGDGDIRLVWADDCEVAGASIHNGGFEAAGAGGVPEGWRFTGSFPAPRYSQDGSVAHGGRSCVAVWYGSQARQSFAVEAGRQYRVSAWFRVLEPGLASEPTSYTAPFPTETYGQTLAVRFANADAARRARIAVAPLYNGYEWSVSARWDDNNTLDLKMRDVMEDHGYRGTFYLSDPQGGWYGPDAAAMGGPQIGRKLLAGGNTIGGHSMTHPFLTYVGRNRQFWEVAAVRAIWEAATDSPINSYAFSFCDFRNPEEGDAVHRDIADALRRAGYLNVANGWFHDAMQSDIVLSPILPSDGQPVDDAAAVWLGSAGLRQSSPHMSFSMHVWYRTPEAWEGFEGQLDTYGHRENWWYCNHNQYAAYRWQHGHTVLGEPRTDGTEMTLDISRPVLRDLNDDVPISFLISGVDAAEVVDANCATARCEIVHTPDGRAVANLSHDRERRLPDAIGIVANPDNRELPTERDCDAEFPAVRGLLSFKAGTLVTTILNAGDETMTDVTVTYRLPVQWGTGVVRRHVGRIDDVWRDAVSLGKAATDYKHAAGESFFVAQVDFRQGPSVGRLHLTCTQPPPERDPSYPQGGFLVLGPLAADSMSREAARRLAEAGSWEESATASATAWRPEPSALQAVLDPEIVATTGRWSADPGQPQRYLLRSILVSDGPQDAALLLGERGEAAYVNGRAVGNGSFRLAAGRNELVVLTTAAAPSFSRANAGCFVRLTEPGTRTRLKSVAYVRPDA